MIRAAAYIRVSTERQAEEDRVSLGEQSKDIATYCLDKGYTVVKEYQDVGSGASKRRQGFQQLLRDVQDDAVDVIVCWKSDRLSRGLYPAAALSEALEGTDILLESVKDTIDRNTFDIMAVVGKIELGNIRERARMGARGRASRGKVHGTMKYGYRISDDHTPEIVVEEAEIVQRVFDEYSAGSGSHRIATRLTLEGIPTRNGGTWTPSQVYQMITNPAYIGSGVYGRVQYFKKDNGEKDVRHHKKMPSDTWITIDYPRIIDDLTWDRAQSERQNPSRYTRNTGRKHNAHHLLKGLLWCSHCGRKYTAEAGYRVRYWDLADGTRGKKQTDKLIRRYVCAHDVKVGGDCPRKRVNANSIEPAIWEAVTNFLTNPAQIHALIEARQEELAEGGGDHLEATRTKLAEVEAERGRVLSQHQQGYINDKELDLKMRTITERLEHLTGEIRRLALEWDDGAAIQQSLDDFLQTAHRLNERIDTLDPDERTEIIHLMVDRVTVQDDGFRLALALEPGGGIKHASPWRSSQPPPGCKADRARR